MTMIQAFPSGGSGKGGHTILDNGTAITERDTLNLIDFDIADDSTDEETDIAAHRLTSAELDDIVSAVPNGYSNQPIVYDERGTEYVIGKYIKSDGTIVPLYQKYFHFGKGAASGKKSVAHGITGVTKWVSCLGIAKYSNVYAWEVPNSKVLVTIDNDKIGMTFSEDHSSVDYYVTLQYIKN